MDFEACLKINNLGARLHDQYGRWGHFLDANAKAVIEIVSRETVNSNIPPTRLSAMLAFTWGEESTWSFNPEPNTNGKPESPWHWDVGPFQLNVGWTYRIGWQQDFKTKDLPWKEVFGESFYEPAGILPIKFNGDAVTHGKCALRRLLHDQREPGPLGFADRETLRVVLFTGPKAQPHRLRTWNTYGKHFEEFFEAYTSD